jgi:hypothetical protein
MAIKLLLPYYELSLVEINRKVMGIFRRKAFNTHKIALFSILKLTILAMKENSLRGVSQKPVKNHLNGLFYLILGEKKDA